MCEAPGPGICPYCAVGAKVAMGMAVEPTVPTGAAAAVWDVESNGAPSTTRADGPLPLASSSSTFIPR